MRILIRTATAMSMAVSLLAGAGVLTPTPAMASSVSSSDWLGEVNYYRSGSGLGQVTDNSSWNQGLANHLAYLANSPPSYFTGQYQNAHTENPSSPYYTQSGAQEAGRSDLVQGAIGESPQQLIDGWLEAPFHAIGILRQGLQQVAFASDPSTGDAGLDIFGGLDSSQSPPSAPIVFPGNGLATNLWQFGGELPDPLETCGWQGQTVGLPLMALLPNAPSASLSATLTAPDGSSETSGSGTLCIVDANTYRSSDPVYGPTGGQILSGDNAVVIIPRRPLTFGTYSVSIAQAGSDPLSWSFRETEPQVLQPLSGEGQSTYPNQGFPQALAVTTENGAGFIETGVPVTFSIGPGQATFPGRSTTATVTSDHNGRATAPPLLAGSATGQVTVTATTIGANPLSYSLTINSPRPICSKSLPSGLVIGMAETADGGGYWIASQDGQVAACGDAPNFGDAEYSGDPISAIASAPGGDGYWLATANGAVYSFGSATYHGGTNGIRLAEPIVAMAADPATGGYWLLGGDGGVFSFDAPFYGSTGNIHLNQPAVSMAASRTGRGYYFVASDGGIFTYGDARFDGSTGNIRLNQPVVGMAVDPANGGYWLDAADGGIFSFAAPFYGSTGNIHLNQPCVGMTAMPAGTGYRFVAADGGIFDFGSPGFEGSGA